VNALEVSPRSRDLHPERGEAKEARAGCIRGRGHPVDEWQSHRSDHVPSSDAVREVDNLIAPSVVPVAVTCKRPDSDAGRSGARCHSALPAISRDGRAGPAERHAMPAHRRRQPVNRQGDGPGQR
jgi:hypothetical protein